MMKTSIIYSIIASLIVVLLLQMVSTDAAAVLDGTASSLSNEGKGHDVQHIRDMANSHAEQMIHSPVRRHHLKFGVLGKRDEEVNEKLQQELSSWLNNWRERRGGRPQYGLLG